jgi:hypothetical protein
MNRFAIAPLLAIPLLAAAVALPAAPPRRPAPAPEKTASAGTIDYDRDIRPVISDTCFKCHGFDDHQRQAGLRLDTRAGAYGKLASGRVAIVPGKPDASEAIQRMEDAGPLHMPPVGSGKKVTPAQIALFKRWIAQGAQYKEHWAFLPPKRPALPVVKNTAWVRNPIDRFILARLEKEGLKPSPEADRATLLRRVSFDLTGLPPTPKDLDAFLADKSPDAYEKQVDRLLASVHYGERMAVAWLDLARYADTHGYHIDSQRDMWRWREWVINAYNQNKPYDQFTIEQLAGDLLPNATMDQRLATGFNRNHPIDFEGGAIPEEYQAAYIFDRIDTTATTFMGLTMRCAQCHTHKYDPITQKDYYRFYALFNNIAENGLDGQKGNAVPFLKVPTADQQAKLDEAGKRVASVEQAVKARAAEAAPALAAWETRMRAKGAAEAPVSAGLLANYALDETAGAELREAQARQPAAAIKGKAEFAPGKFGNALKLDGATYAEIGQGVAFERTDKFSYGAWINPSDNGAMTVVSRMDDGNKFRGWDLYLGDRKAFVHMIHEWEGNAIRVNTKAQLDLNKWTHLFVTYDGSGKAKGVKIYINGKPAELEITHDSLTDSIKTPVAARIGSRNGNAFFRGSIDDVRIYNRELSPAEVEQLAGYDAVRELLAIAPEKLTAGQKQTLLTTYLATEDPAYQKLSADLADARKKYADLDAAIPTSMVMQEMAKPRDTFMLVRGQYDKKGEKVEPGLPEFLTQNMDPAETDRVRAAAAESDAPPAAAARKPSGVRTASQIDSVKPPVQPRLTRLDLAKWLVRPDHPLTARVAVNRYWQTVFGIGLVKTAEDFGTQGERPSHPELLDWLATEFVRTGWNTKAMMRLLVTSATYRQSSRITPAMAERDPENRLLERGPRSRLQAEFVRDQALAISGLLVDKVGGPSVKPYQPAGLWEEIAFGGGFSAQTYVQDHGEDLYRRSMYTFWKRTVPPPSLQVFDAPEREFCVVRRSVTNTPLQALVLMNDPCYVEAARKLAERLMTEGGATPEQHIAYAYGLALLRQPKPKESKVLLGYYQQELAVYQKDNAAALKLLSVGESKRNAALPVPELAAWTSVANLVLNMDEVITKE